MVRSVAKTLRVHFGDGTVGVQAGERLGHEIVPSTRAWEARHSTNGHRVEDDPATSRPASFMRPFRRFSTSLVGLRPKDDSERPVHPPELAPGKRWFYVGPDDVGDVVESRKVDIFRYRDHVVVFREGLAFPTRELLGVANNAHAVLVLRGYSEYFYLHISFVLSAEEEESLVQWGVGRTLLSNSLLAVGGTLLVAFAEQIWEPAIVGTLLVAAAGYRVQGAMTGVLRVRSQEWKNIRLVPSGIHGAERVVQVVIVTLVVLADLLDDRVLQLVALTCASVHVVLLEVVGHAVLTWGWARYTKALSLHLVTLLSTCAIDVASLWFGYVFAGLCGCLACSAVLRSGLDWGWGMESRSGNILRWTSYGIVTIGLAVWAGVNDWNEADLKFSPKSLETWRRALFHPPDSIWTGFRIIGNWSNLLLMFSFSVSTVYSVFMTTIGNDRVCNGERTSARRREDMFSHYDVSSIPSRNLLGPCAGPQTPDVRQTPVLAGTPCVMRRRGDLEDHPC